MNWILITFHVEIVALMACVSISFTTLRLVENDNSLAWMRPFGIQLLLVLLNKPNLVKCACIDLNSFACCFPNFWKEWRHRYALFYDSKVFFLLFTTKTSVLQRFNLLHIVVLQRTSQKRFSYKKAWWHTRRTWYHVKFWWWKSKDRKCYMYLKFHINPPYIVLLSTVF